MMPSWSESALAQVEAIKEYISRTSGAYAQDMARGIFDAVAPLASFPLLGPMVPEWQDEAVREVFHHPYRIIYRVDDRNVIIIAVIHAARQLPTSPPKDLSSGG
jgi:plasmid stabilization system protein ParE